MKYRTKVISDLYGADMSEFISIYLEENNVAIQKLDEAIRKKNEEDVRFFAHKMKGAALTIGDKELAELCYELESHYSSLPNRMLYYEKLENHYHTLSKYLNKELRSINR